MPDIREITGTILIAGEDRRALTGNECELIRRMLCGEAVPLEPSADQFANRLSFADEDAIVARREDAGGNESDEVVAAEDGDPERPPETTPLVIPQPELGVAHVAKKPVDPPHVPDQNNPTEAARLAARPGGPEGMLPK